jgi:hypothetical protein
MTKSKTTSVLIGILALGLGVAGLEAQARRRVLKQPGAQSQTKVDLKAAINYKTPRPDGKRSCNCNELERRLIGLRTLLKVAATDAFSQGFPSESQELSSGRAAIQSQVDGGSTVLDGASGKSYADQERLCGEGLGKLQAGWSRWQPFLGQNGLDSDYYRHAKASNPGVPDEGDLSAGPKGRVCDRGQWWTEDRALWAINGREGICKQQSYEVKQILAGKPGDSGHRCFKYELR